MKKHYRHENDCLNCGTELQGKYCHHCGQENLEVRESFGHMLNHAVSDYFHFDHQFFHTLKPLLFQPGKLTIEYMKGRRAQYLHPVKMYIFISLVYFLLIFKSNHEVVRVNSKAEKQLSKKETAAKIKKELDKNPTITEAQKKAITNAATRFVPADAVKKDDSAPIKIIHTDGESDLSDTTVAQYTANQNKLPADERDNFWERLYYKTSLAYKEKYGKNYKEMFMEDVRHNAPKMMFVLLPLFALILRVAFWRNKKYYVEHLIYSIHLHCFYFLFAAVILIIQFMLPASWSILSDWLNAFLFLYSVYYIYRSLRTLYQRGRWRTISKMVGITIMYWFVFCVCAMGLIMIIAASAS